MASTRYSAEELKAHKREYAKEYQRKRAKQARYGACLLHAQQLSSRLIGMPDTAWEAIIVKYLLEETKIK